MSIHIEIFIDLTDTDGKLNPEELEEITTNLADQLQEIVEDTQKVREADIPEGGKSAFAGFIPGMLKTLLDPKKAKELLDLLGNRFYGKTLTLEYEDNGKKYKFDYTNPQQMEAALAAFEKLAKLKVSVNKVDG
jgi:hypothetical protein